MQNDKVAATAVLMFIVNPASIHHSMMYTEALFTTTSWLGLYCLYCQGTSLGASLAFAASSAVRSNGECGLYCTADAVAASFVVVHTLFHWKVSVIQVPTSGLQHGLGVISSAAQGG
jgi:hypothetical protein